MVDPTDDTTEKMTKRTVNFDYCQLEIIGTPHLCRATDEPMTRSTTALLIRDLVSIRSDYRSTLIQRESNYIALTGYRSAHT